MKSFLLIAFVVSFASASKAQISFNDVTYSGSGCRKGSVSTVISPDGESISILFDEFRAEIPQFDGDNDNNELPRDARMRVRNRNTPTVSHKNCSLSFTATLKPGTRVETLEISMQARGVTIIDEGVEGHFAARLVGYKGLARFNGEPILVAKKTFRTKKGPIDESWTESPSASIPLKSVCSGAQGRDIRFDLKNHINVESIDDNVKKHGMITVDSNDLNGLLKFRLRTRPCGGAKMSPP